MKLSLDFMPEDVRWVLQRLTAAGFDAWLVGGALRDFLRGTVPKDWDLATSATPEQVMGLFPRVIPIGVRHGTVQIHNRRRSMEITSCAAGFEGIRADLGRRDFTVNALALSFPDGLLLDPFAGQGDLLSLMLRAVGNPRSRFLEDPLRTLRAGRFIGVQGFHLERETFRALKEAAPGLQGVAKERIREELLQMVMGEHFAVAFHTMMRGGVIREILPELLAAADETDSEAHLLEAAGYAARRVQVSPFRIRVRLAALFQDLQEPFGQALPRGKTGERSSEGESALPVYRIMQRLRASKRLTREVVFLVGHRLPHDLEGWTPVAVRRFLAAVGPDFVDDIMDLARADRMVGKHRGEALEAFERLRLCVSRELEGHPPLRIQDLTVTGRDVMEAFGLEPGPLVGELLERLHEYVLENPAANEPKFLMDFLRKEYNLKFQFPPGSEEEKRKRGG